MPDAVIETRIPLRWTDTDALGHVYHGVHVALIDEARGPVARRPPRGRRADVATTR